MKEEPHIQIQPIGPEKKKQICEWVNRRQKTIVFPKFSTFFFPDSLPPHYTKRYSYLNI